MYTRENNRIMRKSFAARTAWIQNWSIDFERSGTLNTISALKASEPEYVNTQNAWADCLIFVYCGLWFYA